MFRGPRTFARCLPDPGRDGRGFGLFFRSLMILSLFAAATLPRSASAAPPGKAWAPIEGMLQPGYHSLLSPRLDLHEGRPRLYATAVDQVALLIHGYAYDWGSAGWNTGRDLGIVPLYMYPLDAPAETHPLLFGGSLPAESRMIFWAEDEGGHVTPPERIASTVRQYEIIYAGAARGGRRWAALRDRNPNDGFLRLFVSDEFGVWNELIAGQPVDDGLTLMAVDDTTAMLVWSLPYPGGLRWGLIHGNQFTEALDAVFTQLVDYGPKLRRRPSGGAWLTYVTSAPEEEVWRFDDGGWGLEQKLPCNYTGAAYSAYSIWVEVSHDAADRPVVVWSFDDYLSGSGVCACVPGEDGWGVADEIFRGGRGAIPATTRDRNGDAWVAWGEHFQPMRWTHTYTTATAREPVVSVAHGRPELAWKLSEPAPGSWWAVLRQARGGTYEEVARLQAGPESEMSWIDEDYRPGTLLRDGISYRIRRESVDTRYEHLGPIGSWSPGHMRPRIAFRPQGPGSESFLLEFSGTTGSRLELTIYDVSGRAVERRELSVREGTALQTFPLTFAARAFPAGIYFARVRDESGAMSDGVKFVRLR